MNGFAASVASAEAGAVREAASPNHGPRPAGSRIDMLVLHYTGMGGAEVALARLRDPAAQVSAHYLIDETGEVFRLVPEERRAWHAGRAFWAGECDVNSCSIGVELVNPGHALGYRPFPDVQMRALEVLARDIVSCHPIPSHRVLGHSDVAPWRKADPGELFDWARLARAGVGLWPDGGRDGGETAFADIAAGLARLGYEMPEEVDVETLRPVLVAFQRHWRPGRVDGVADRETAGQLAALLDLLADPA